MKSAYRKVGNLYVEDKIFSTKFCCDYEKCGGACCNQPLHNVELLGGDLSDYEAADILFHRKALSLLCDNEDQHISVENPVTKCNGHFYTTLKKDRCVFCSEARKMCVLKTAKKLGIGNVDIPLSCHLYPIVLGVLPHCKRLSIGHTFDDYCAHAYQKGERDGVFLIDFLRASLIKGFGKSFYSKLKELQKDFL